MRLFLVLSFFAVALLPGAATADDEAVPERVAGTIVSVDGETFVVDLGDETGVSRGTVLQVYRQLPSQRGTAAYRDAALWWEVGKLEVRALADGVAVAVWSSPAAEPLPSGLDESGAPADQVHVGDRVRATAAVGSRPARVRVTFATSDLFQLHEDRLLDDGAELMGEWLRGLRSMDGPIEIEVHPRIAELGEVTSDVSRELSDFGDAPFGPAPGEPTVPVEGLYQDAPAPVSLPDGREVMVVDEVNDKPDVWRYLDPITLARKRGERVAAALASHLGLESEQILVRVVPRPTTETDLSRKTPGYDTPLEQLRILASGIDWDEPAPLPAPRSHTPVEEAEPDSPSTRKRRLLERVPIDEVS